MPDSEPLAEIRGSRANWQVLLLIVNRRINGLGNSKGELEALQRVATGLDRKLADRSAAEFSVTLKHGLWDFLTSTVLANQERDVGYWLTTCRVNVAREAVADPQLATLRREIEDREKTEGPVEDWRSFQEPETGPIDLQKSLF